MGAKEGPREKATTDMDEKPVTTGSATTIAEPNDALFRTLLMKLAKVSGDDTEASWARSATRLNVASQLYIVSMRARYRLRYGELLTMTTMFFMLVNGRLVATATSFLMAKRSELEGLGVVAVSVKPMVSVDVDSVEGTGVGREAGTAEGAADGFGEGASEGCGDGAMLGRGDGAVDGAGDGAALGIALGVLDVPFTAQATQKARAIFLPAMR